MVTHFQSHEIIVNGMADQNCVAGQQAPEPHLNVPQRGGDWPQHGRRDPREATGNKLSALWLRL